MKLDLQLAMDREETYTLQSWDTFYQEVEQFVGSLDRHDGFANDAFTEYAIERLEVCIVGVTRLKDMFQPAIWRVLFTSEELRLLETYYGLLNELLICLRELARKWAHQWDMLNAFNVQCATDLTGRQGRPKFDIRKNQLEYLEGMSFNWSQISQILGVSRTTIYKRRVELSMDTSNMHRSNISDDELEHFLRQIRRETPALGERMIMGSGGSRGGSMGSMEPPFQGECSMFCIRLTS